MPLAFETMGAWGDVALGLIADIGRRIFLLEADRRFSEFLKQRVGIEIRRGNAISVLEITRSSSFVFGCIFLKLL